MRLPSLVFLLTAASGILPLRAEAQTLPDSLVQRIRAGAARVVVPGDSVVVPMVGTPTLPLVEARVNGTGPWRLLIDLGSNVTLLRRNVVDASRSTVLVDRPTSDIVHVRAITLGAVRIEDVTLAAYDELDVDGVIGYNVLQYTPFTLDFPRQRLVLHHQQLPPPDGVMVFPYRLEGRMPYVTVMVGEDSLVLNLDTGATEWMTIPPGLQSRLRWAAPPAPGRVVSNNQTGPARVLEGRLADTLRFGPLAIPSPLVYVNPDADDAWLGAAAMQQAAWTFDPGRQRVRVTLPNAPRTDSAMIRFRTGGFWLNLHHYLYVLGRAEAGLSDATRQAVAGAPVDQDSVLARLSETDQRAWRAAVRHYAAGPSRLDPVFDSAAFRMIHRLSQADASSATRLGLDPALVRVLEPAARIYRTAWWPRHDAANRARAASLQPLLDRHQDTLRAFVSRAYGMVWPSDGFDLHLSAWVNWAGAYSTTGPLIVMSSFDAALDGWHGVETAIHEALHQWDDQVQEVLAPVARGIGLRPPRFDLVHAMIFATAGEAVRRIVPGHVEYAEAHGLWRGRSFAPYAAAINTGWRPWLRGEGTLADAVEALVRASAP